MSLSKRGGVGGIGSYASGNAVLEGLDFVAAELCPNEKMGEESGFLDTWLRAPTMPFSRLCSWGNLDNFHRNPVPVNPSDFRQLDVYKGLLVFQP